MIALARDNAAQVGIGNVEFLHGHIEDIPLPGASVDVVISNCVINLSPAKPRVLAEAFRVLRPGGRLGVSDIIADEDLDPAQRAEAERLTGCTIGTLTAAGTGVCCWPPGSPASPSPLPATPLLACTQPSSRPPGPLHAPRRAGAAAPGPHCFTNRPEIGHGRSLGSTLGRGRSPCQRSA